MSVDTFLLLFSADLLNRFIARFFILGAAILFFCGEALAVNPVAFGFADGYSNRAIDKIIAKWPALPQLKAGQKLALTLSVDEEGKVLECKTKKGVGSEVLEKAVCDAARAASPFGSPPYGLPTEMYLAVWSGPEIRENSQAVEQTGADSARLAAPTEKKSADPKFAKYLASTARKLRDSMYVPEKTLPGIYEVTTRIKCDASGKILSSSIIKGSGDALLDKYVLQGLRRAGKVAPPPKGLGNVLDLTFTLKR